MKLQTLGLLLLTIAAAKAQATELPTEFRADGGIVSVDEGKCVDDKVVTGGEADAVDCLIIKAKSGSEAQRLHDKYESEYGSNVLVDGTPLVFTAANP
jgi:hypothetical protein